MIRDTALIAAASLLVCYSVSRYLPLHLPALMLNILPRQVFHPILMAKFVEMITLNTHSSILPILLISLKGFVFHSAPSQEVHSLIVRHQATLDADLIISPILVFSTMILNKLLIQTAIFVCLLIWL